MNPEEVSIVLGVNIMGTNIREQKKKLMTITEHSQKLQPFAVCDACLQAEVSPE